jgi:hypothetical protein
VTSTSSPTRYNLDPYLDWAKNERIPIIEAVAVDLLEAEVGPWARYDARGAIVHCKGRGDFCNMFLLEIPAGKSTAPQRHIFTSTAPVPNACASRRRRTCRSS